MATQQHRDRGEKAFVVWNMSNCPIPYGYDPIMVVHRIETALGRVRPYGEISITAIEEENLIGIPGGEDVMRKLSSIGISLKHAHHYHTDLTEWAHNNPPPSTLMVIDGHEQLGWIVPTLCDLEKAGCRIILVARHGATPFPRTLCDWDALLSIELETTPTTTSLVNRREWSCSVCFIAAPSFEDFTTHLKSVEHEFREWDRYASKHGLDRTNTADMPFGRSSELDLLLTQEIHRCQEIRSQPRRRGFGFMPKHRSNSQSKY